MPIGRPDARTLAAFAASVVFLGTNFVAVRFSNRELAPAWGGGLRFLLASLLLLVIVAALRVPRPRGRALVGSVLFGLLAFGANFGLLYWALVWVPAGVAAVVFATIPLTTFLIAVSIRLETFRWPGLMGGLVVLAGIGALSWQSLDADVPVGPLLAVLLASVCAALSGIVVKRFPRSHPLSSNAVAMAVGSAVLLLASVAREEPWRLPSAEATWAALGWLVASSVVAFTLMVWVIGRWTASANAYGSVLAPLITIPAAASLAGEPVTPLFAAASGLVLWGVYIGALYGGRPNSRGPPASGPAPASTPKDAGAP